MAALARAHGGADVVELPDAGHFVQEEAAADVAAHVVSFLAADPGRPRIDVS